MVVRELIILLGTAYEDLLVLARYARHAITDLGLLTRTPASSTELPHLMDGCLW